MTKNFNVKNIKDIEFVILEIEGSLDAHSAPILENEIQKILDNNDFKIIISFKNLEYISSAGLGVFMSFIEFIRKNNGDLKLCEMSEKIFSIFDLLGFPMIFDITDTLNNSKIKFNNINEYGSINTK